MSQVKEALCKPKTVNVSLELDTMAALRIASNFFTALQQKVPLQLKKPFLH